MPDNEDGSVAEPGADKDYEKAVQVLRKALARTRSGKLTWRYREERGFAYEVDLTTGNLEVGTEDNDGAAPFDFKIFGRAPSYGLVRMLNTRHDAQVRNDIRELHELAGRQLSGVDVTLDGLLGELDDEDDLPF